jgi:hypothetical protein
MATAVQPHAGQSSSSTSHLFIVGLSRTGSTLTRGILNASPEIFVGGESHFLSAPTRLGLVRRPGYADRFRRIGDLKTDAGLARVLDHLFALRGKSFWARLASNADRTVIEDRLRATAREDRDLLDVAMEHFAAGRRIRGEKTPHHVHHVPTLLDWFPQARIIHTFRDPRAVYVSLRRKERPEKLTAVGRLGRRLGPVFDSYSIVNLATSWSAMARLHEEYAARFGDRYTLVRFEDLVAAPRETAARLSAFVGVDFSEAMLDQVVHNSSFSGRGAGAGIDSGAIDRWRDHLPSTARLLFRRLCGDELEAFGYRR